MEVCKKLLPGLIAMLPASLMADSFLAEETVKYRGDRSAIAVCEAVVEDNAQRLELLMRQERRKYLFGNHYTNRNSEVLVSVECNGMDLFVFADKIGAASISEYLGTGTVTVEEVREVVHR